jgi:hypothetical protein
MKSLPLIVLIVAFGFGLNAQVHLQKKWDHTFGSTGNEVLTELIQTADGGFVLGGYTNSPDTLDVSDSARGGSDYWIVRLDTAGHKLWDKRYGGSFEDKLFTVLETTDGGFLLGGLTTSDSGFDVSQPTKGSMDYWIVKTDASGNKLWDKRYGGQSYEQFGSAVQTPDGGYLLGGWTASDSSGDMMHYSHGAEDFWVVKIDSAGTIQWEKNYGGDGTEEMYAVAITPDGGFILGGRTLSNATFDVTEAPRGDNDYWMIKINANGVKQWDKRYGGGERDNFYDLKVVHDGGFILGGYIRSDQGGDITEPTRDTSASLINNRGDVWLVRTDSLGQKIWDHRFGGHWVEAAFGYVFETHDHGFMFGTASYSNMSGDKSENNFGYEQEWILKTDSNGSKIFDKTIHVDGEDEFCYPLESSPGCYVIADWSAADSSSYKSEDARGLYDFWVIKFCETSQPQVPTANFTASSPVLCENGCFDFINQSTNASTFQWYFPGGTPSSSTMAFPTGVCYSAPGSYDVTLIAISTDGADTTTIVNAVSIVASPSFTISSQGDTLSAPQGFQIYQWWFNGTPLANDTNYFTVAAQNGDYIVTVIDSNGCFGSDTAYSFNVLVNEFTTHGKTITVYPNPAKVEIRLSGLDKSNDGFLQIHDLTGRLVFAKKAGSSEMIIPVENLNSGLYLIEIEYPDNTYYARFVKN